MPNRTLPLLLTFDDQVRRDQAQTRSFLQRRDRKFALDRQAEGKTSTITDWLSHLQRLNGQEQGRDQRLSRWRQINTGFALAGLLLGSMTMAGLMFYDGSGRINLTVIIAVVLLQLFLATITTLQAVAGWQPWRWLTRRLTLSGADEPSMLQQLNPQLMARAAHIGGLGFGFSGLVTLLVLITVKDLAFGWSTTLSTGADSFYALVHTLAWPWHTLWPDATPTLELVSDTRFYRAATLHDSTNPQQWGAWWPFVTMLWLSYVAVPRLVLMIFAGRHLQYRARKLLQRHPGLAALHERMATPTLDTGTGEEEVNTQPDLATKAQVQPWPEICHAVVQWAGASADLLLPQTEPATQIPVFSAGGGATLADDEHTLQRVREHLRTTAEPQVSLLTRAWEPPTAELADFLEQARTLWPAHTHINLVPLAADTVEPPPQHQLDQWLRFAERQQDALVMVCSGVRL